MERLTEWIDDGEHRQAIPKTDIRNNGHNKCCNKLAEYEDLEEQGLLVRLPDDLSRVLYQVNYRWKCTEYGEENDKCEIYDCKCECDIRKEYYIAEVELQCIPIKSYYNCLGEFLFFTSEAAEKKLEEMKKND